MLNNFFQPNRMKCWFVHVLLTHVYQNLFNHEGYHTTSYIFYTLTYFELVHMIIHKQNLSMRTRILEILLSCCELFFFLLLNYQQCQRVKICMFKILLSCFASKVTWIAHKICAFCVKGKHNQKK